MICTFKLFKLVGKLVSLLMSSLTSSLKAIKYFLANKSDVSMPVVCSNSF